MNGLDMSMVPFGYSFHDHCVSLSTKDSKFLARVNDAVKRILTVKQQVGLFDNDRSSYPVKDDLKNIGKNETTKFNLDAARESIVLVKNDNYLPAVKNRKILVAGTTGNSLRLLNGGWSYKWQGDREDYFTSFAKDSKTIYQAVKDKVGGSGTVLFSEGANFTNVININDTVAQANTADIVLLCIGERTYTEILGNIDNLYIDDAQQQLADALTAINKPVIVVYIGGRPRIITKIVENPNVKAVLVSFLPGNRGSEAIADILFGDYSPDGRLPITYPRNSHGQTPYDLRPLEIFAPNQYEYLYPFGHGLSYTTFSYSDLSLNTKNVNYKDGVQVSIKVKNTGTLSAKETVILYLQDSIACISRPIKQVKGIKKIQLGENEEKTVTFNLTGHDFTFINQNSVRIAEDGDFIVFIQNLNATFTLSNSPAPTAATTSASKISATTTTTTTPKSTSNSNSASKFVFILSILSFCFLAFLL